MELENHGGDDVDKPIISIEHLNFKYEEKEIFKDFSINFDCGTFNTIIGMNGSGKTTLAKILCGLLKYEGYINIDSYSLGEFHLKEIRRLMGIAFDNASNYFIFETVRNELAFSLENLQYTKEEIAEKIKEISHLFYLGKILDKKVEDLNNNEKQRLMIACALIHEPKILILDEALSNLPKKERKDILKILKKYQKTKNLTIIMITHYIEDSLFSDRLIVLNKGKIYLDGKTLDVLEEEKKLSRLGIDLPFMIELSINLKLYNLIDKNYINMDEMIDAIWK